MMKIRRERNIYYLLLVLTFLITGELCAQQKDFGSWWELSMDGGLQNGIKLSGEIEQRFSQNSQQFDRTLFTLAGEYDLKDYLNVGAGFRTLLLTDRESRPHARYRIHADATGHHAFSSTELSLRIRFQYGFEDILYIGYFSQNNFISRQRLKLSHHFFGTRIGVLASVENWIRFNDLYGRPFYKIRLTAGAQYDLSLRSGISIRYILEHEFNVIYPIQAHILALSYSYSF